MNKCRDINPVSVAAPKGAQSAQLCLGAHLGKPVGQANRQFRAAFTLIELTVVVVIIGILMMILFPTIQKVWQLSRDNHVMARMQELALGCDMYRTANQAYPGQANSTFMSDVLYNPTSASSGTVARPNGISGSQMLAACLFSNLGADSTNALTYSFANTGTHVTSGTVGERYARVSIVTDKGDTPGLSSHYTNNKTDLLDFTTTPVGVARTSYWTIADQNGQRNMPILYYVSRPGQSGLAQYKYYDNYNLTTNYTSRIDGPGFTRYWGPNFGRVSTPSTFPSPLTMNTDLMGIPVDATGLPVVPKPGSFYDYITATRLVGVPGTPVLPCSVGQFLMVAPGGDGIYGTQDDIKFGF